MEVFVRKNVVIREGRLGLTSAAEGVGCSAYCFPCCVGYAAYNVWRGGVSFCEREKKVGVGM